MEKTSKIWGCEKIICNNDKYCAKFLLVDWGGSSSTQYHKQKDETFHILEGKIGLTLGNRTKVLKEGDTQRIVAGKVHRFEAIGGRAKILEISTHHRENDTVRTQPGFKIENAETMESKL